MLSNKVCCDLALKTYCLCNNSGLFRCTIVFYSFAFHTASADPRATGWDHSEDELAVCINHVSGLLLWFNCGSFKRWTGSYGKRSCGGF